MLKRFAHAGTCAALLGMGIASIDVAQAAVVLGASVGKAAYSSSDFDDGSAKKFSVGYELAGFPVFVDLAMQTTDDAEIENTNASVNLEAMQLGGGFKFGSKTGFGASVKVGYYDADFTVVGPFPDEKSSNTGFMYGVGLSWMFVPMFGLRAEWERLPGVEHYLVSDQDVTVTSAGVIFKFGAGE